MLKVGDNIFMPRYGAGTVVFIKDMKMYYKEHKYICIDFCVLNMKYFIPEELLKKDLFRSIVDLKTLYLALDVFNIESQKLELDWNTRYKSNRKKINSGDIFKICDALRELYFLKVEGIMPVGEEKILVAAEDMLISEIMMVLNLTLEEAKNILNNKAKQIQFSKNALKKPKKA